MPSVDLTGLSVLLVEDEMLLRKQLGAVLERLGADVHHAANLASARGVMESLTFDFVLLDVNLPDGKGSALLEDRAFPSGTSVVVMTADPELMDARRALELGADDFLAKPFEPAELPLVLRRVKQSRQQRRAGEHRRSHFKEREDSFFFGDSLAELEKMLSRILAADERMQEGLPPVLIEGETGTGKTTIARWIHHHGPRRDKPLIEVNCSALPESLAESELFGHEKGAFTDARTTRMGLFEAADEGTLFLDELPSLPLPLQAKVLTAIEDRKIRRLGGNKSIPVDTRVIAATNSDLKEAVARGEFREDLYHRLDLYRIAIPPLRTRGEDILLLCDKLLELLFRKHRLPPRSLSEQARQKLLDHPFPGNVRELAHELERAIVFEDTEQIELEQLSKRGGGDEGAAGLPASQWFNEGFVFPQQGFDLEQAILKLIHHALQQTRNNVSGAARLLGVTRDYVRYRLENEGNPAGAGDTLDDDSK